MMGHITIVTGYFGAPIKDEARRLAQDYDAKLIDLDREIEKRDGRSIRRLVMMNGEHGYRNLEYEVLKELSECGTPCVVACGDGVLYDDDSRELALANELIIVGDEMTTDELWEAAKADEGTYHAFMSFGTEEQKRAAFRDLIARQRSMFDRELAQGDKK